MYLKNLKCFLNDNKKILEIYFALEYSNIFLYFNYELQFVGDKVFFFFES